MQTKKYSLIEAITNTLTGLVVAFCIQIIIYPIMDIPVKLYQNIIITIVFTAASILRSYLIRRIFNNDTKKGSK